MDCYTRIRPVRWLVVRGVEAVLLRERERSPGQLPDFILHTTYTYLLSLPDCHHPTERLQHTPTIAPLPLITQSNQRPRGHVLSMAGYRNNSFGGKLLGISLSFHITHTHTPHGIIHIRHGVLFFLLFPFFFCYLPSKQHARVWAWHGTFGNVW